ncbi:MAG TPA: AAA domain-containing protein [Gaiellaceae bacterium]|jgi:very-short-patch-repair endonuclease
MRGSGGVVARNGARGVATSPDERTLEDVALPDVVEGFTKRRVELVQRAVKEWTASLIDLGGRNNLLRYRDLKAGTLELTNASPTAVAALLQGKSIKTSTLFRDPEERARNVRRLRTIANKAKENFEERGLETLSIACGLATWTNEAVAAWEPSAPVLLRQATLRPLGAAQDEYELALVDEMEVSPTLLHYLKVNFDCSFDQEKLLDRLDGVIDEAWELDEAYRWIVEHTSRVPEFRVEARLVLANFAYAKLPMVRDLQSAFDELVAHDLIAAIAGDEDAREAVRSAQPGPEAIPSPDAMPPADEFLVLDADSSQNWAINAILAGESLIVRGPPGTGKSQTIANLIGSMIARNQRVLFVAEKRAAIEAVVKRLDAQGIGDLVLDLHGGIGSRRAFAAKIGAALAASRTAPRVERQQEQRKLEKRRDELNEYVRALHEERMPWGITLYELRSQLLALRGFESELRVGGEVLARLDRKAVPAVEEDLAEYARLDGFSLASSGRPWSQATVASAEEAQHANAVVEELRRHRLPQAIDALERASESTRLPAAATVAEWAPRLQLWQDVAATLEDCEPSLYEQELETLIVQLAPAETSGFARMKASLLSGEYKQARSSLRPLMRQPKTGDARLLAHAQAALDQRTRWSTLGGESSPRAPDDLEQIAAYYAELTRELARLAELTRLDDLEGLGSGDVRDLLELLIGDRGTLITLPELHRLRTGFLAAGLGEFIAEMQGRAVSEETAIKTFRFVWLQSILDTLALSDRLVEGFNPSKHEKAVDDFRKGDREHLETTSGRIRRLCAEQTARTRDEQRDQSEIVEHQARLKRRHMPVRDLVRETADVLLALKPCWAMSPLVVSQLLPPKTYFDAVIFDEASQVTPSDAIPALLRGRQLVVAGDEKQLPPTAFFVSESPEEEEEEQDEQATPRSAVGGTVGFESILDALGSLLRPRMLRWHYRSRDERLIAFSNAHIYDRMLITFPGVGGDQVLRHVLVPHDPTSETNSPSPEVDAVVELIVEHARERPNESLGVIAMGIKHANRIDECRLQRLRENPELEIEVGDFFGEDKEERFFVKNLERVQGDERDAIILSIGYGKNARGDLPYRFGPLLTEGGERRLNVAITRAKHRITLVSSFEARDMDPERSQAAGVELLRQYLQYVDSGGENLGDVIIEKPELNPFEVDVRDTLSRHGLKLVAQYGSSGYWIDYAVAHPTQPGRHVLAIECDGATYHSSESARDRDRLRQEQLERIGWRFHRIWSSDWFYNRDKCVEKVMDAYRQAVEAADREDAAADDDPPADPYVIKRVPRSDVEASVSSRRGARPRVRRNQPIGTYTRAQLVQVVRWIETDDLVRTEDDLLLDTMAELGFQKRGTKIVAAIRAAIRQARA